MKINDLYLYNFRNYSNEFLEFSDGVNFIYGANGQGKTNIIEAFYYFCTGRSFKNVKDKEVIKFGEDFAKIKINFESEISKKSAEIILKDEKIINLNGVNIKKLSELVGFLKAVLFTPDCLNLIKGGPSERRHFLDVFISSLYPVYFKLLLNYYKVLKQKNTLLKSFNADKNLIFVWNEKLAEFAHLIFKYRFFMIDKLSPFLEEFQNEISKEREKIKIVYNPSVKEYYDDKQKILDIINEHTKKEIELGFCLIGPHRDDFSLFINGKDLKHYGSQGQIRCSILSLKLAECEVIKEICGEYPVLLFDDITSEIDSARKSFIFEKIKDKQVFITCTEKENLKGANYIKIESGKRIKEE